MPTNPKTRRAQLLEPVGDCKPTQRVRLLQEPVRPDAGSLMRIEDFCRATQMSLRQFSFS